MYAPSLIPTEAGDEEKRTIVDVLDSLRQFQTGVDVVLARLQRGVDSYRERLRTYNRRVETLERKIDYLKTSTDVPALTPPARYPTNLQTDLEPGMHSCLLDQLPTLTPFHSDDVAAVHSTSGSLPTHRTSAISDIKRTLAAKSDYAYVFAKRPKFLEATTVDGKGANRRPDADWRLSAEFVIDPGKPHSSTLSAAQRDAEPLLSESLLSRCDFGNAFTLDPYSYRPDSFTALADKFKLPDLLPDLPVGGLSADFDAVSMASSSAFLSASAKSALKRTMDVDLTASRSFYATPIAVAANGRPASKGQTQDQSLLFVSSDMANSATGSRSDSASRNLSEIFAAPRRIEVDHVASRLDTLTLMEEANHIDDTTTMGSLSPQPNKTSSALSSPPPPPPPPPPVVVLEPRGKSPSLPADVSKDHSDLMEAIRAAGGTKNARLKKVSTVVPAGVDTAKHAPKANGGDDLMSSLAKALEIRRRGISGKKSTAKQFSALERRAALPSGASVTSDAFSRLRQMIPVNGGVPATVSNEDDKGEEDDGDW